eukprot:scaffold281231_cov39-Prasinocladus_malaysianus.AAC.1
MRQGCSKPSKRGCDGNVSDGIACCILTAEVVKLGEGNYMCGMSSVPAASSCQAPSLPARGARCMSKLSTLSAPQKAMVVRVFPLPGKQCPCPPMGCHMHGRGHPKRRREQQEALQHLHIRPG